MFSSCSVEVGMMTISPPLSLRVTVTFSVDASSLTLDLSARVMFGERQFPARGRIRSTSKTFDCALRTGICSWWSVSSSLERAALGDVDHFGSGFRCTTPGNLLS